MLVLYGVSRSGDHGDFKEGLVNVRRIAQRLALGSLMVLAPALAGAQDFGVMNSAQTIQSGAVKLSGFPVFTFGQGDDDVGLSLLAGYGLTSFFDIEGRFAIYDDVKFGGIDAEIWFLRGRDVDLSATVGYHAGFGDIIDTQGVDVTLTGSRVLRPGLELYGALDFAFNTIDDVPGDNDYTTAHLVPGVEYRLRENLDFVAEIGVGLTDDSRNYVAAGLAFYIR
jgi:hypothetical protein